MTADPQHREENREEAVFHAALEAGSPEERREVLHRLCGSDCALRRNVEELLQAHERFASLLPTDLGGTDFPAGEGLPLEKPGDQIGRYKLLEPIGQGGCGIVWMAEQREPVRRRVALKIIKLGMDSRSVVARFEAERQALARMDHPHIARVFDGGATDSGRPYFVMELVRGRPITRYCDEEQLPLRERLELFAQVCRAVQHAHQKGVIHRDLKPANVLIQECDGRAMAKVIDFGVAKAIDQPLTERTLFTHFGQIMGTPAYMSPEQAGLGGLDIDTRSDVYSLGVVLYELLTGRLPFDVKRLREAGYEAILRTIREEEPPKPSTRLTTLGADEAEVTARRRRSEPGRLRRLVRGELDWIVMKALEKDRARRYETANGLALDLERHLSGQLVLARPPGFAYRCSKWVRRNRVLAGTTGLIAATLVAAATVSLRLAYLAIEERNRADYEREQAERAEAENRARYVQLVVTEGVRAMENRDEFGALVWFSEALRLDEPGASRTGMLRVRLGSILEQSPGLVRFWTDEHGIQDAIFSPDGRWILTADPRGTVRLREMATGRPGPVWAHPASVSTIAFSGNGERVLTVCEDGLVRVWDRAGGRLAGPPLEHAFAVSRAVISSDGRRVITAGDRSGTLPFRPAAREFSLDDAEIELTFWDAESGRRVGAPLRRRGWIHELELSPDGRWLAARLGSWSGSSLVLWDLRDPEALVLGHGTDAAFQRLPGRPGSADHPTVESRLPGIPRIGALPSEATAGIACFAFSPDGRRLATGYGDGSVSIRGLNGGPILVLRQQQAPGMGSTGRPARAVRFTADGGKLLMVHEEQGVLVWDARSGGPLGQLQPKAAGQLECSPDGRLILVSSQVWDIETDRPMSPDPLHLNLRRARFHPDGLHLLTIGKGDEARLWNLGGVMGPAVLLRHPASALLPPAAGAGGWTGPTGAATPFHLPWMPAGIQHATFSPDGEHIATGGANGLVRVWRSRTGEPVTPFLSLGQPVDRMVFAPDGSRLFAAGGFAGQPAVGRVWEARTGAVVTPDMELPGRVLRATFSPDGDRLVVQTDEEGMIWDVRTGVRIEAALGLETPLRSLALSGDGTLLAIASGGRPPVSIRILDIRSGKRRAWLREVPGELDRMEFSADGRRLFTVFHGEADAHRGGASSSTVQVWDLDTGEAAGPAFRLAGQVAQTLLDPKGRHRVVRAVDGAAVLWEPDGGEVVPLGGGEGLRTIPLAISAGFLHLVVGPDGAVQLREAGTGAPVTPPLGAPRLLPSRSSTYAVFSADERFLAVLDGEEAEIWRLARETRPVEELIRIAGVLAGRRIREDGLVGEWTPGADGWPDPGWWAEVCQVPVERARSWRDALARDSEARELWHAAVFHLQGLIDEGSPDETLPRRRARARDQAALRQLR